MGKSFNYNKKSNVSDGGSFRKDSARNRTVEKDFVKTFRSSADITDIDSDELTQMLIDGED